MLTKDNYYSLEANQEYLSVSQYKDFMSCEARALAVVKGKYVSPTTIECLVGSYIHAWSEGSEAFLKFKDRHPEIISSKGPTKGQLKEKFVFADNMIATLEADPLCMMALQGQKEVTMTGQIAGVPWKIRMDVYQPGGNRRIVDLKTTKSINELVWSAERWAKVSFIDAFNYPLQFAVYARD